MITAIKSDFLKLFTVRSTYVIISIALLLLVLTCGYVEGYKAPAEALANPRHLIDAVLVDKLPLIAVLAGVLALLQFSHEYRYNSIMYTLTSVSRNKFLASKIIATSVFALLFSLLAALVAVAACLIGIAMAGGDLAPQSIAYADVSWRLGLYVWCYAMLGLLFVALARNQVFAAVGFFIFPATIEPLLGLLLKSKSEYLPYASIESILVTNPNLHAPSPFVALIYIIVFWAVAWLLFLRRDAN